MKIQGWALTALILMGLIYGCSGDLGSPAPDVISPDTRPSVAVSGLPEMMDVVGSAAFGNQCPYGSYVPPAPVPIELWNCPLHLPKVELVESLPSLILQADCKKKTLDVRSEDHSVSAVTWEVMPDGNFYITFNAGVAKLKNDGEGHANCVVPMVAYMWGRIDCKDRDKANIKVETVWRLGVTLEEPTRSGSPVPLTSPSSSPLPPFPTPSVTPSDGPSPWPHPHPTPIPTPTPVPSHSRATPPHSVTVQPADLGTGVNSLPACQIPSGCYFHSIVSIDQCT